MPGTHHDQTANTFEVNFELEKRNSDFVAVGGPVGSEFADHKPGREVTGAIYCAGSALCLLRSRCAPPWEDSKAVLRGQGKLQEL
jgi:hypothetical protein